MSKVNLDIMKPWINDKISEMLGFEDDVVIEFVYNQLDQQVCILHISLLLNNKHI